METPRCTHLSSVRIYKRDYRNGHSSLFSYYSSVTGFGGSENDGRNCRQKEKRLIGNSLSVLLYGLTSIVLSTMINQPNHEGEHTVKKKKKTVKKQYKHWEQRFQTDTVNLQ